MFTEFLSTHFHWRIFKSGKAVCCACAMMFTAAVHVQAAPQGGVVKSGKGNISRQGTNTNIDQQSQRLDIDWRSFSTDANEAVNFAQPNTQAVAINRVTGGVPSHLKGALHANGKVFLLNNAGVTFHKGATVNVGALLATTAELEGTEGEALRFIDRSKGAVVNRGEITVGKGGFAILAAPVVENHGKIEAEQGNIALASSKDYTLDLRGDQLITYTVADDSAEKLGVTNTGELKAAGGQIALTADVASELAQQSMNLDGLVDASGFGDGKISITSRGDINMNDVTVDAGTDGDIYTWADGTNHVTQDAVLKAEGGIIEVSGNAIKLEGTLEAGKGGKVILDPEYLRLRSGTGPALANVVYEGDIEALSQAGTNVELRAEREITVEDLADDLLFGGDGDIHFRNADDSDTRTTYGGIRFLDWDDTIRTTGGDIKMQAGSAGIIAGNLETQTGRIVLDTINDGNIQTGGLKITNTEHSATVPAAANLHVDSSGSIDVNGDISLSQEAEQAGETTQAVMQAKLEADKRILVKGEATVRATAYNGADGDASHEKNATALASLEATSREDTVQFQESLNVTATNWLGRALDGGALDAKATLALKAANRVQLDGVTNVTAGSYASRTSAKPATVDADAEMNIEADDVLLGGNIEVAANAHARDADTVKSHARLVVEATDNRVLTEGNLHSRANSGIYSEESTGTATADALTHIISEGDAVLQGEVASHANTTNPGEVLLAERAFDRDDTIEGGEAPLDLYAACDECWNGYPPARARTVIDTEDGVTLNREVLPLAEANSAFVQDDETREDIADNGYALVLFDELPMTGNTPTVPGGGNDTGTGGGNDTTGGGDDTTGGGNDDTTTGGGDDTGNGGNDDTQVGGGDDTGAGGNDTTPGERNDDTVVAGGDGSSGGSNGGSGGSNDTTAGGGDDTGAGGNNDTVVAGGDTGRSGNPTTSGGSDDDVSLLSSQEGDDGGDFSDETPITLAGLTPDQLAGLSPAAEGRDFCRDVNGQELPGLTSELQPCPIDESEDR